MDLSPELHQQIVSVLRRCSQFDDDETLKALFVTNELRSLQSYIVTANNKAKRVNSCINLLLNHSSSRVKNNSPLLSFLKLLRNEYVQGDHLFDELNALCSEVSNALFVEIINSSTPTAKPFNLNDLYVERPELQRCCREVVNLASLIRIKSPRQMGKTWLMQETLEYAKKHGFKTTILDFNSADTEVLSDLNKLLRWMCSSISEELGLVDQTDIRWINPGAKNNITNYFKEYLLPSRASDLVLALDNVDMVFRKSNIVQDFCGLLRTWVSRAKTRRDSFQKLRLIVVHSTEEYGVINIDQSPLNSIGIGIELGKLQFQQVCQLARKYGLSFDRNQLEQVREFLGGHPYLVNLAFKQIANEELTLEKLFDTAHEEYGIYSEHLQRQRGELGSNQRLLEAFKTVISTSEPIKLPSSIVRHQLRSMGLINLSGTNATVSCEVYRRFFCNYLGL